MYIGHSAVRNPYCAGHTSRD